MAPKKKRKSTSRKKKQGHPILRGIGKGLLFVVKTPYYATKGIIAATKKVEEKREEQKIEQRRASIQGKYKELDVIETIEGDYTEFEKRLASSDSEIGIILGSRGSGKTAFGVKVLENMYVKHKRKCFALGFKEENFPSWIRIVDDISELENDSFVLIDEGGILFNSRSSMSNANKLLTKLMLIARHKNLTILFISQNSSNLEVNILRQADFLILKRSSLLQKEFERKIIQKLYTDVEAKFKRYSKDKGITYIYSSRFRGFVSNALPSFWGEQVSKSFKET